METTRYSVISQLFYIGRWWGFSITNASLTFLSSHLNFSDVKNSWFSSALTQISKTLSFLAMNDVESTHSSGYYSDFSLKKEQQVVDEPYFTNISQCNIDRLVFDENNHERPPFSLTFCCGENTKLDWSLLVILIHHLVILILVFLYNFSHDLWGRQQYCIRHISTFVCLLGPYSTDTKAMIKRISTQPRCFISVVGPAGSGKTRLIGRMIVNQEKMFSPCFDKNIYFYKHYQQNHGTILMDGQSKHIDIEFIQGWEWNFLQKAETQKRILLVLDDLFDEAAQNKDFLALVLAGRHRNVHLMVSRHNLFQRAKNSKTIDLNVTQIILFNSPRDSEQIGVLGRQLGERYATMKAYWKTTQKVFGHLMIDLNVRSSKSLRYSANCSGDVPSIFYCSTDELCLHLDDEFTKLLLNWFVYWLSCYTEKMLHLELLRWNNHFFCDCIFNAVKRKC